MTPRQCLHAARHLGSAPLPVSPRPRPSVTGPPCRWRARSTRRSPAPYRREALGNPRRREPSRAVVLDVDDDANLRLGEEVGVLTPLDDNDPARLEHVVDIEEADVGMRAEAVEVDVVERACASPVHVMQDEGRTAHHCGVDAHAGGDPAHEHRLARTQLTAQKDEVPGLEARAETLPECQGVDLGRGSHAGHRTGHAKCRDVGRGAGICAPPSRSRTTTPDPARRRPATVRGASSSGQVSCNAAEAAAGTVSTSSKSSPPPRARSGQARPKSVTRAVSTGTRSSQISTRQADISLIRSSSTINPSLMSPPQRTPRATACRPSAIRGAGASCAATQARSWLERSPPPSRSSRSPAAARPSVPVTSTRSPGAPRSRRSASPGTRVPPTDTSMTNGPSMALTSPPATAHPACAAIAHSTRCISRTSSATVVPGAQRVTAHHAGLAPIPARSDSATDSARAPSFRGVIHERRKSTPSTSASWLIATSLPGAGAQTAASSPLPIVSPAELVLAISASALSNSVSPTSTRVGPPVSKSRSRIRPSLQRHTSAISPGGLQGTVGASTPSCTRYTDAAKVRAGNALTDALFGCLAGKTHGGLAF